MRPLTVDCRFRHSQSTSEGEKFVIKIPQKFALLVVALFLGSASAQVSTGLPPFGSLGGGPFDTVNLGNLNVHFSIPVLHKAGRGIPFTYDLSYDSSVWTPVMSGGITQWN